MDSAKIMVKKHYTFIVLAICIITYACLLFIPEIDHTTLARYHIGIIAARFLDLTFLLPLAVTWFAAFYGYDRLQKYAKLIRGSKDGKQILLISRGVGCLALALPFNSITNSLLSLITKHHTDLIPTLTIMRNRFILILPLAGFVLISLGARRLTRITRSRPSWLFHYGVMLAYLAIAAVFTYMVMQNATSDALLNPNTRIYYVSTWWLLSTVVIPYLYMWYMGITAVGELWSYNQKTKGLLYRQSWTYIFSGFAVAVLSSITVQFITAAGERLNHLHLNVLLLIVYAFLLLEGLGYVLIALGAKKLQKIEEV